MAETITPEQRARDVLSAIWNGSDAVPAIAHTIRAAETAAVERCVAAADGSLFYHGVVDRIRGGVVAAIRAISDHNSEASHG